MGSQEQRLNGLLDTCTAIRNETFDLCGQRIDQVWYADPDVSVFNIVCVNVRALF